MCTLPIRNLFPISKSNKNMSKKNEIPHLTPEDHKAKLLKYKMTFIATKSSYDTPASDIVDTKNKLRSDDPITQPPLTKATASRLLGNVSLY